MPGKVLFQQLEVDEGVVPGLCLGDALKKAFSTECMCAFRS